MKATIECCEQGEFGIIHDGSIVFCHVNSGTNADRDEVVAAINRKPRIRVGHGPDPDCSIVGEHFKDECGYDWPKAMARHREALRLARQEK